MKPVDNELAIGINIQAIYECFSEKWNDKFNLCILRKNFDKLNKINCRNNTHLEPFRLASSEFLLVKKSLLAQQNLDKQDTCSKNIYYSIFLHESRCDFS